MSKNPQFFFFLIVSGILFHLAIAEAEARPFDPPTDPETAVTPIEDSADDGNHTADEGEENPDEWEIEPDFAPDPVETPFHHEPDRLLEIGSKVSSVLGPRGAFFIFYVEHRQSVEITTTGSTDTLATLLDEGRRIVATDDDSGTGRNFRIEADLLPGWYLLHLEGSWGSQGPYTLYLSDNR